MSDMIIEGLLRPIFALVLFGLARWIARRVQRLIPEGRIRAVLTNRNPPRIARVAVLLGGLLLIMLVIGISAHGH